MVKVLKKYYKALLRYDESAFFLMFVVNRSNEIITTSGSGMLTFCSDTQFASDSLPHDVF